MNYFLLNLIGEEGVGGEAGNERERRVGGNRGVVGSGESAGKGVKGRRDFWDLTVMPRFI